MDAMPSIVGRKYIPWPRSALHTIQDDIGSTIARSVSKPSFTYKPRMFCDLRGRETTAWLENQNAFQELEKGDVLIL